jgi:hypothetical protein
MVKSQHLLRVGLVCFSLISRGEASCAWVLRRIARLMHLVVGGGVPVGMCVVMNLNIRLLYTGDFTIS